MPRIVSWGTPGRSEHYPPLRRKWGLVLPAALAGTGIFVLLMGLHAVGLRSPTSPGGLVSQHATIEASCEQCHSKGQGVANVRCQRCHDPAGSGRTSHNAHVLFGSRDAAKAAASPTLECAGCHVEHRGRRAALSAVTDAACSSCHFRGLSSHPELQALKIAAVEVPGLKFSHARHVDVLAKEKGLPGPDKTCGECHPRSGARRDLEAVTFEQHCAPCHSRDDSVGSVEAVSEEDALPPQALVASGLAGDWRPRLEEFDLRRGTVAKTSVAHRDRWVIANLTRLRRDLDPTAHAAERGALLARRAQLERRLALASPMAALSSQALKARVTAVETEIRGLDGRIGAQARAVDASAGLGRLEEVRAALAAAGSADGASELLALREKAGTLRRASPSAAVPKEEFDARRSELLALLEAVGEADPALGPRVEDLRRRLLALRAGEVGVDVLKRVREQRKWDLERAKDEMRLREQGVAPPSDVLMGSERRALARVLTETEARLTALPAGETGGTILGAEAKARKMEAASILAGPCEKCHVMNGAAFARVAAARPVLVRARFLHEPHLLQADCARCHAGIEKSKVSSDLHLPAIASCRECHRPWGVREDCASCHRYHAPAVP